MAFGAVASAAAVGLGACACWLRSCYRLLLSVAAAGRRAPLAPAQRPQGRRRLATAAASGGKDRTAG